MENREDLHTERRQQNQIQVHIKTAEMINKTLKDKAPGI